MADAFLGGFRPCAKCGTIKPWTLDYFRSVIVKGRCTLRHRCRICEGYRDEGPDRLTRRGRLTDEEREVARSLYNRRFFEKDPEHAREIWRASSVRNKEQRTEASKRRWANRDVEETKRKYADWKAKNAERVKAYARDYGAVWRERNAEKSRAKVRKWRAENPRKALVSNARWRARKAAAVGSHTFKEITEIYRLQGGRCFYCDAALVDYHVDHFIPLSLGGSDFADNLRIACPTCNCRKSSKLPWDWMPDRFSKPVS